MSDDARMKKFRELIDKRNMSAEKLLYILPKYLYSLEKDQSVDKND